MGFYDHRPAPEKPYPSRKHAVDAFEQHMPMLVLKKLHQFGRIDYTVQEWVVEALKWMPAKTLAARVSQGITPRTPRAYAHDRMVQRLALLRDPFQQPEEGE